MGEVIVILYKFSFEMHTSVSMEHLNLNTYAQVPTNTQWPWQIEPYQNLFHKAFVASALKRTKALDSARNLH